MPWKKGSGKKSQEVKERVHFAAHRTYFSPSSRQLYCFLMYGTTWSHNSGKVGRIASSVPKHMSL